MQGGVACSLGGAGGWVGSEVCACWCMVVGLTLNVSMCQGGDRRLDDTGQIFDGGFEPKPAGVAFQETHDRIRRGGRHSITFDYLRAGADSGEDRFCDSVRLERSPLTWSRHQPAIHRRWARRPWFQRRSSLGAAADVGAPGKGIAMVRRMMPRVDRCVRYIGSPAVSLVASLRYKGVDCHFNNMTIDR